MIYSDRPIIIFQVEMQHCNALGNNFTLGGEQLVPGEHHHRHRRHRDLHKHLVQVVGVVGVVSLGLAVGSSSLHSVSVLLGQAARLQISTAPEPSCNAQLLNLLLKRRRSPK